MSNNNSTTEEEEIEELLASRGFKSDLLRIRGFSSYGYRDRSRDVLSAIDLWNLELKIIPMHKAWRNYVLYDHKSNLVPVLGVNGQVLGLRKDEQKYYDTELLYLPVRFLGQRWYNIAESELSLLEQESRQEPDTTFWAGEIPPNDTPVRSLLEKVSPYMLEACHLFVEDPELNAKSEINNNPRSEDIEIFYKVYTNTAGHCGKWDCPIHQPVQKFVEAHNAANKKMPGYFLIGCRFDHPEAIRYDNLKALERLVKLTNLTFNAISLNTSSIWDTWSRLDELDN